MRRVVVTGMGAITPLGNDLSTFWQGLVDGRCGIDFIQRFDTSDLKVKIAGEVKDFDPTLYIPKCDVKKNDLYTQYAMGAATQAVEQSGILGTIAPERFGVYIGSGIGGMTTFMNETIKLYTKGAAKISPFFIPMMIGNIAAGSVAIRFQAKGPCLPIVSACATGTHAVGEAFHAIKQGYADAIIAGGAEACLNPLTIGGFTNCMALSTRNEPASASIPFDKRRDGFVLGEGSGILILEEYQHAVERGATIYAEVVGYGNTCDAHHITAPDPEAVVPGRAIRLALEEGGLTEEDSVYINAHGTSTPLNDKTETKAIKVAMGERAYKAVISSTKSMTGHMLGAAGAVEAIVAVQALATGIIPPTIGYQEPDEDCDLDYCPNQARKQQVKAALSTSLGFGGHNACVAFTTFTKE